MMESVLAPAILCLGPEGLETARRIRAGCPDAAIRGLAGPVDDAEIRHDSIEAALRDLYRRDVPIIALCAAGTVIRALGPLLGEGQAEPPVLAVAEDGSAVVPLLGLRRGAVALSRVVGASLGTVPAFTSSDEDEGVCRPVSPVRRQGRLAVIGLGPGGSGLMAPEVREELRRARHIIGYETYVRMAGPFRPDQIIHSSDNRVEMDRARHAFALAAAGEDVVVVSSGDPGIFAMATAVLEALHLSDEPSWHSDVELVILPGISAAQAAAARAGAPLGHDFCTISLSDNLKPWPVILSRLDHAATADLVLALYNPISIARPWQLGEAIDLLRRHRDPATPVVLGRDVGRPGERTIVVTLGDLRPDMVDMRTVVIVGSSTTRSFPRSGGGTWVYTPRWYGVSPD
ncbi:precorrin-3B C(17)-methyltransferase [Magnetospirillum molischianum]|uniref:Precorrin-3B C(17)-methyltransferase (Modular protein) n=1 Tax=Magnetospirillum molischianum DSM 120 TaxID=1150626 RepID=H8FQ76_MAGML|nr:precorrin-3B C(17)-methyltransferase [Magnetospirillum molischianum]CCG40514.1 Precorrin-3B C(17)-methyltransferase (modular protein) [Magnetospirillum molischianum DSM 120]